MYLQNNKKLKQRKMKTEEINVRINTEIKNQFKEICELEKTTMSNKIHDFILSEIKTKLDREEHIKKQISLFVKLHTKLTGDGDIIIINKPMVVMLGNEIVDDDSEGHLFQTQTYFGDLLNFINENKDKKIYIYLAGCDLENNKFRLFTR